MDVEKKKKCIKKGRLHNNRYAGHLERKKNEAAVFLV
jgi:hypothetical protein